MMLESLPGAVNIVVSTLVYVFGLPQPSDIDRWTIFILKVA